MSDHDHATILVVEDDPTLLSVLAYSLRRGGYDVLTASHSDAALAQMQTDLARIDLVLLDLMLPGIDGRWLLRTIRRDSSVPVLIISARFEPDDKVDAFEMGADDYVVKQFVLRELLARICAALRRQVAPVAHPTGVLHRGPLMIEPDQWRAAVGDQELQLRPKEFGLLVTLAMDAGRVFSRQTLLDHVWGEETIVDERTVDVHISWLRGKLLRAGLPGQVIRTVYGAGYRFVTPAADLAASVLVGLSEAAPALTAGAERSGRPE